MEPPERRQQNRTDDQFQPGVERRAVERPDDAARPCHRGEKNDPPENVGHDSEQRVDERRDGARLRKYDQEPEQDEDDNDRHEPVLLLLAKKLDEF